MKLLNAAGSFANVQLRRLFAARGQIDPDISADVTPVANLDPERVLPYGQWIKASAGVAQLSTAATAFRVGIVNPINSGAIAVIEQFAISADQTLPLTFAMSFFTAVNPTLGYNFVNFDSGDSTIVRCPLFMHFNLAAGATGSVLGGEFMGVNGQSRSDFNGCALYPGHMLNVGSIQALATNFVPFVKIRFIAAEIV